MIRTPFNLSVAAARTCYSSKGIVTPEDVVRDDKAVVLRDRIAASTLKAGHLTTRQHASFVFTLDRVSRHFLWSFLHSHPYYNSEQVSQRYVKVSAGHYTIPPLTEKQSKRYVQIVDLQMERYNQLIEILLPEVRERFFRLFPQRRRDEAKYAAALKKRAYEVARYVLPVATHAYLYHTVSALTLLRYWRLANLFDTSFEQRYVIGRMMELVCQADPDFEKEIKDPLPLEETPEYQFFAVREQDARQQNTAVFLEEFDGSLEGRISRLVDYKAHAENTMAASVRNLLGIPSPKLSDKDAIDLVMNPEKNRYLGDTFNLTTLSKLSRAMFHPHYTFRKKISHTADSQDQRHRMTPGSRPILERHYSGKPDAIVPMLIRENAQARETYEKTMSEVFRGINDLLSDGVGHESALYLLPNAFPIRFEESGDLLNQHHKWKARACYTAQEEIFFATIEEIQQVREVHPMIAEHILAPCYLRRKAGETPYCPEGDRFCGLPVWKYGIGDYTNRIL